MEVLNSNSDGNATHNDPNLTTFVRHPPFFHHRQWHLLGNSLLLIIKEATLHSLPKLIANEEEELCETFEVQGFPTIHYGDVNEVQDYTGGRDYDSLSKFAKENLEKPICSIHNIDACDKETKEAIRKLETKSAEELHAIVEEFEKEAEEADAVLQAEIERIEEEYNTRCRSSSRTCRNTQKEFALHSRHGAYCQDGRKGGSGSLKQHDVNHLAAYD